MKKIKVFASGSCRILQSLDKEQNNNKIEYIHTLKSANHYLGKNFIGKMHTINQHIQLIKYLTNTIEIPRNILSYFLSTYNSKKFLSKKRQNRIQSTKILMKEIKQSDIFIFEICSIKEFMYNDYQLMEPLLDKKINNTVVNLSHDELVEGLHKLVKMIKKPIIFQTHFRPNIFLENDAQKIENREIIYNACKKVANETGNYIHDPSELILLYGYDKMLEKETKNDIILYNHFTEFGHKMNAKKICEIINNMRPNFF